MLCFILCIFISLTDVGQSPDAIAPNTPHSCVSPDKTLLPLVYLLLTAVLFSGLVVPGSTSFAEMSEESNNSNKLLEGSIRLRLIAVTDKCLYDLMQLHRVIGWANFDQQLYFNNYFRWTADMAMKGNEAENQEPVFTLWLSFGSRDGKMIMAWLINGVIYKCNPYIVVKHPFTPQHVISFNWSCLPDLLPSSSMAETRVQGHAIVNVSM